MSSENFSLNVVLVKTKYDSNIGAASRAMANMGATQLILVSPQCTITMKAHHAAATGQRALENRLSYSNWQDFEKYHSDGVRIGFSTKDGLGRQLMEYQDTLDFLKNSPKYLHRETPAKKTPIYLIFGAEDSGLSNEDIEQNHFNCNLPTFGENPSLNLAQAVLLALFQARLTWGGTRTTLEGTPQPKRELEAKNKIPDDLIQEFLKEMGLDNDPRPISAFTVIRRLLLHNVPSTKEIRVFEVLLRQGIRKMREYNEYRKSQGLPHIK